MEFFYLKKSEFLSSIDENSLENFDDKREYKSVEKRVEHLCGLFLVKFIAKNVYGIENTEIKIKNNKPYFLEDEKFFSISHSKDIILVGFDNFEIGVDIEFMEDRDFNSLIKRYDKRAKNPSKLDFYRFWTFHEAEIKLNKIVKSVFSKILDMDYVMTGVSSNSSEDEIGIKKIECSAENIDLKKEYENPKNLKLQKVA